MAPTERITLPDAVLRRLRVDDADALARAVSESLDHLRPWMAWADNGSATARFQRERLKGVVQQWKRGDEFQYGLFDVSELRVIGAFGLMTRRGRASLEIGYWMHPNEVGHGHATRAVAALTNVALQQRGVKKTLIYTDVANERSAAIPRRLGYTMLRVEDAPITAAAETGRQNVWMREEPISEG